MNVFWSRKVFKTQEVYKNRPRDFENIEIRNDNSVTHLDWHNQGLDWPRSNLHQGYTKNELIVKSNGSCDPKMKPSVFRYWRIVFKNHNFSSFLILNIELSTNSTYEQFLCTSNSTFRNAVQKCSTLFPDNFDIRPFFPQNEKFFGEPNLGARWARRRCTWPTRVLPRYCEDRTLNRSKG